MSALVYGKCIICCACTARVARYVADVTANHGNQIVATFSGLTFCSQCFSAVGSDWNVTSGTLNGAFTLTLDTSMGALPDTYILTVSSFFTTSEYDQSAGVGTCNGVLLNTFTEALNLTFQLFCASDESKVVWRVGAGYTPDAPNPAIGTIFVGSGFPGTTILNTQTGPCGLFFGDTAPGGAFGGQVTILP